MVIIMPYHPLLIVANSKKNLGRCVAGIDLATLQPNPSKDTRFPLQRPFIRPVSNDDSRALDPSQIAPVGMDHLPLFQIVEVPLQRPFPEGYQTENWLVEPNLPWKLVENQNIVPQVIEDATSSLHSLWTLPDADEENHPNYQSSRGQRDRIPESEAETLSSSLALISLDNLRIDRWSPSVDGEEPQFRGNFQHNGRYFNLRITDLQIENLWSQLPRPFSKRPFDNNPNVEPKHTGPVTLTVSLGLPYRGHIYRLIANVHPDN